MSVARRAATRIVPERMSSCSYSTEPTKKACSRVFSIIGEKLGRPELPERKPSTVANSLDSTAPGSTSKYRRIFTKSPEPSSRNFRNRCSRVTS